MHSVYFISDFSYNPSHPNPVKIFELGDAFNSDYPGKKLGKEKSSPYTYFINDLKKRYPNALLVQVLPSGLNIDDLENNTSMLTYDKEDIFNDSPQHRSNSFPTIVNLIIKTIQNAVNRSEQSRLLVIAVGHPKIFDEIPAGLNEYHKLKLINYYSRTLHQSFYNKRILHDFAYHSPIYPKTLCLDFDRYYVEEEIKSEVSEFITSSQANHYVIKPTDGTHSEHVHTVAKDDLLNVIGLILDGSYSRDACSRFHLSGMLIQACHQSKLIPFKGKSFLAKARAIIRADFDEVNPTKAPRLNLISGYWQLAKTPYNGEVNDDTLIANMAVNSEGVVEIDAEDWNEITSHFQEHLPPILHSMASNNKENDWTLLSNDDDLSYGDVINQFLKQQVLIPHGSTFFKKIFHWRNTYIENSDSQEIANKFIFDMIGSHQTYSNIYRYQSSNSIVKNAVTMFNDRAINMANHNILSLPYKFRQRTIIFFLCLAIVVTLDFILNKSISPKTFLSSVFSVLISSFIIQLALSIKNPSSFYSNFFPTPADGRIAFFAKNDENQPRNCVNQDEEFEDVLLVEERKSSTITP
ncbi:MAG: hypothetical protein H0U71_04955 [Gammaproteobacteria bacterium]|nr:hypothetical protein [Gammaproteobacteria bacterium]